MDQQLLRDLRKEVAESLSTQRREDDANGLPTMSAEDIARSIERVVIGFSPGVPRDDIAILVARVAS